VAIFQRHTHPWPVWHLRWAVQGGAVQTICLSHAAQ